MSTATPQQGLTREDLEKALRKELVDRQDMLYATIGGLAAFIICSIMWATLTVITHYQIGYVAIGVGVVVGICVRYFGAGIDLIYGVIAALFALLGCAFGNLLSSLALSAEYESMEYFEALKFVNLDVITTIFIESFSLMHLLFYAIAASAAFRVARRDVEQELETALATGKIAPPPYQSLRLPVAIVAFVMLSAAGYFTLAASNEASAPQTYSYASGQKQAMGALVRGKGNGEMGDVVGEW
jgi:hypothetical protein